MDIQVKINGANIEEQVRTITTDTRWPAIELSYKMCEPEWWLGSWLSNHDRKTMRRDIKTVDDKVIGTIEIIELEEEDKDE